MSNTITPFIKRMRTQGGTIYTFTSALEDIGLNISERSNNVKISNFALLNIPPIEAPSTIDKNTFNVFAPNGAFANFIGDDSIKDGRVIIAESFQNYALNFEANLLNNPNYNANLLTTVSERVFWKWLKETGAIRWSKDSIGYFTEENTLDSSVGYNSVVKYIGELSAGSIRTDKFGTYNETYVLVPTSHGQTFVFFKQVEDENYYSNLSIGNGATNVLGRENYTKPHFDGLDYKAVYDSTNSSTVVGGYNTFYMNDSSVYTPGWWYTYESKTPSPNSYLTDDDTYIANNKLNTQLKYENGGSSVEFLRSNLDCMSIEFNMDNLKIQYDDPTLTFDKLAIEDSINNNFDFNAILLYYTVYNKDYTKVLARNLLGVLFLDTPSGNTSNFPATSIIIPSITKLQSGPTGFGTSYSFKVNIKSDNLGDDTQAIIIDESTSAQTALTEWSDVFDNLSKSLDILNKHTQTINYISQQYNQINDKQNQIMQVDYLNNASGGLKKLEFTLDLIANVDYPYDTKSSVEPSFVQIIDALGFPMGFSLVFNTTWFITITSTIVSQTVKLKILYT